MITKAEAIKRAAEILRDEAEILRNSHSINGKWKGERDCDVEARDAHDEMLEVAQALEEE